METLLHVVPIKGNLEMALLLLAAGGNLNVKEA